METTLQGSTITTTRARNAHHRLVDWATSVPVLHAASLIGLVAWSLGFVIFVARISGPLDDAGQKVGGDYFNFYAAGRMVLEGNGPQLYDFAAQQAMQRRLVGDPGFDSLAAYVNPPVLALLFAPLSALPFPIGFVAYTLLMLAAFGLAIRKLLKWTPALQPHAFIVFSLSLLFFPIIRTITGGQNTALTLLLICGLYDAHRRRAVIESGLWLTLLAYKPQFVLLFLLGFVFQRQVVSLGIFAVGCVGHYLLGAVVCGLDWPMQMIDALRAYVPLENAHAQFTLISLRETVAALFPPGATVPLSVVLMVIVGGISFLPMVRRRSNTPGADLLWPALVPATILLSAHAQFYDAGLLVFSVLLLIERRAVQGRPLSRTARVGLMAAYLLFPLYFVAEWIGFQPLLVLVVLVWAWAIREVYTGSSASPALSGGRIPSGEVSHVG